MELLKVAKDISETIDDKESDQDAMESIADQSVFLYPCIWRTKNLDFFPTEMEIFQHPSIMCSYGLLPSCQWHHEQFDYKKSDQKPMELSLMIKASQSCPAAVSKLWTKQKSNQTKEAEFLEPRIETF